MKGVLLMLKRCFTIFLSTLLATSSASTVSVFANDSISGLNQIKSISQKFDGNISTYYDQDGNIVSSTDLNNSVKVNQKLPSSYDLRDYNRSTGVRNQGTEGLCWDFAATASIESSILTKSLGNEDYTTLDLSEGGNSWYIHTNVSDSSSSFYYDYLDDPDKGTKGNVPSTVAEGLSNGFGTYPESMMEYSNFSNGYPESLRFYSNYKLKNFNELSEDINLIKQKIIEIGAITYEYNNFSSNYYNLNNMQSYYDNGSPIEADTNFSGHAVSIIGWDDNYSADNFNPEMRPKNNGAWLCKNSWGDDEGCTDENYKGYFWVSYENHSNGLGQFEMQSSDSFDNIYQHQFTSTEYHTVSSAANIFTAESNEKIKQIAVSNFGGCNFSIDIYKLSDNYTSPVDGECLTEFDANVDFTGIHIIECPNEITLNEGEIFSVVIKGEDLMLKFKSDNYLNPDIEGKSYFINENGNWTDVAQEENAFISYAVIKAYTSNIYVNKNKLSQLIKDSKETATTQNIDKSLIDELNAEIITAETVIADENAPQNKIDNTYCILKSIYDKVDNYVYSIDSLEDFYRYYDDLINNNSIEHHQIELNIDLDFSESPNYYNVMNNYEKPFTGVFNGNGHTIKGFNLITDNDEAAGFFGYTENAIIKDVVFDNISVNAQSDSGIIVGAATDTQFINCVVKNANVRSKTLQSATFVGDSVDCSFINCKIENCSVIGNSYSSVFANDNYSANSFENCTATNYSLISTYGTSDNNGFSLNTDSGDLSFHPLITLTDKNCTIENFLGEIKSINCENASIKSVNGIYEVERINGNAYAVINYEKTEQIYFSFYADPVTKEIELETYYGQDNDVVLPSEMYGLKVTKINQNFYMSNSDSIESLSIPGSIESIPDNIFSDMTFLETLTLNEGIKTIGSNNFSNSYSLKNVVFPDSLISIEDNVFSNCENLLDIKFGNSIENIGEAAFLNCISLKNINFPNSLKTIEIAAFSGCGTMSVVFGKNIESISAFSIGYTSNGSGIVLPEFVINGYAGTNAEEYAKVNGFTFIDLSTEDAVISDEAFDYNIFLPGDVNLDGRVSIIDATLIQSYLAGNTQLTPIQQFNAIVGNYYQISIENATFIQKYLVGLTDSLESF